jgi:hypothetical protein
MCWTVVQHERVFSSFEVPSRAWHPTTNLVPSNNRLTLHSNRVVSATVEEVYQAMRNNPGLPNKDKFVQRLNAKLKIKLDVKAY